MTRARYPAVDAVGELIRTRVEHVEDDLGVTHRLHVPCLLQLLVVHLYSSARGAGGGHSIGSVPLNTQAWDLLVEIRHNAHAWAELLGVDPKPYARADTPRAGKPVTPPIGKLLRAVAVTAATTAREQVADAITRCARRWATQIDEIVAGQREQRGVRGATCPACGAATVVDERDDPGSRRREDGLGSFTVPAVVVIAASEAGGEATLCCLACGWTSALRDAAPAWAGWYETRPDDHRVDAEPGHAA